MILKWPERGSGGSSGSLTKIAEIAKKSQRAENQLDALDAEIEDQKDKVEAKRKVLDTIVRITGRPYFEGSQNSPQTTETQLKMMAEQKRFRHEKESGPV